MVVRYTCLRRSTDFLQASVNMVFLKLSSACNLNVVLTVLSIGADGDSKLEMASRLAKWEDTEGFTSILISLGKPGRQTRDDKDGFHKL